MINIFLKSVEIFSLLDDKEREIIAGFLKSRTMARDAILFKEGDAGNELFIVKEGEVASTILVSEGNQREVALFKTGNFFGEMSIFDNAPRSATCYCKSDCELLGLGGEDFYSLIEKYPGISVKIMYRMLNITAQRLRDTSGFLSDMVNWGEAARKRAITDELTGAYNRRYLDDALGSRHEKSLADNEPFSLIMIDLDYFREVNEHYGHDAGDKIIREVVRVIKRHLAEQHILARYGGDEFVVLLPATLSSDAFAIAENIRNDVRNLDILLRFDGPLKNVTTSQGIASFPEHARDLEVLRGLADKALYSSKESGRDRVTIASAL